MSQRSGPVGVIPTAGAEGRPCLPRPVVAVVRRPGCVGAPGGRLPGGDLLRPGGGAGRRGVSGETSWRDCSDHGPRGGWRGRRRTPPCLAAVTTSPSRWPWPADAPRGGVGALPSRSPPRLAEGWQASTPSEGQPRGRRTEGAIGMPIVTKAGGGWPPPRHRWVSGNKGTAGGAVASTGSATRLPVKHSAQSRHVRQHRRPCPQGFLQHSPRRLCYDGVA
jgi:hypothetical protein